jgi:hypothetical protein
MQGIEGRKACAARLVARRKLGPFLGLIAVMACFFGFGAPEALAAEPPTVTINPNPKVDYTQVEVSGEVTPDSETAETKVYGEFLPCTNVSGICYFRLGTGFRGEGPKEYSGILTGLKPSTEYTLRFIAESSGEFFSEPNPIITTPAVAPPAVTFGPPSSVTARTATFSGTVDPNAPDPEGTTTPGEAEAFGSRWHFQCDPACPGLEGTVAADDTAHPVAAEATGLEPGTTYEVSLVAENAGGSETAPTPPTSPLTFATPAAPPTPPSSMPRSIPAAPKRTITSSTSPKPSSWPMAANSAPA